MRYTGHPVQETPMLDAMLPLLLTAPQGQAEFTLETMKGPVRVERMATLEFPWGMSFLPDGRLLITEKPGRLRIYDDGQLSPPLGGVPRVAYREQGGLMDVEIHPNFRTNRLVYLYFIEAAANQPRNARDPWDKRLGPKPESMDVVVKGGAVGRGRLDGDTLRDFRVIWRQTPKMVGRGHFGGRLAFAPDGKLFISGGDRQRFTPAQDPSSNIGKMVRIGADGSIPADNPRGARRDVWSTGHRNILGMAFHPTTRQLWVHEMGPWHGDELNLIQKGANYGWPIVSNGSHYDGSPIPDHATQPRFAAPRMYWHPAISPSGMMFYTGSLFPSWKGDLFMGGLSSMALFRLRLEGTLVKQEERIPLRKRIRDVAQGPDGSIWLLTDDRRGELLRLSPGR